MEAVHPLLGNGASLVLRADSPLFQLLLDRNIDPSTLRLPVPVRPDQHGLTGEHTPAVAR
jgi:hypothetical protein